MRTYYSNQLEKYRHTPNAISLNFQMMCQNKLYVTGSTKIPHVSASRILQ